MKAAKSIARTALYALLSVFGVATVHSRIVTSIGYVITSAAELIEFSDSVNNGTSFKGTTVLLGNDIDFSVVSKNYTPTGPLTPSRTSVYFSGTFDGQGYVVRNLNIESSHYEVGLLGFSRGTTVRNVVTDASCSVTGTYVGDYYSYVAGILGHCIAFDNKCVVESCVNMATVSFSGRLNKLTPITGGVAGECEPRNYSCVIKGCVNYGTITFSGSAGWNTYVGGVLGKIYTDIGGQALIQNCLNYGTAVSKGSTNQTLYMGGVTAFIDIGNRKIENCVNFGLVQNAGSTSKQKYSGSIVGCLNNNSAMHCYWEEEIGLVGCEGKDTGTVSDLLSFNTSFVLSDGRTLVTVLNENAGSTANWSVVEYHCNGGHLQMSQNLDVVKAIELDGRLRQATKENNRFLGWYTDAQYTQEVSRQSLSEFVTVYAKYGWTVSFDTNGGTQCKQLVLEYNEHFSLPDTTKVGHTFAGWTPDKQVIKINDTTYVVPNCDVTLSARWTVNNYTVKFVSDGATVSERKLLYGSDIIYPENQTKDGYTFIGWCTEDLELCDPINVPSRNITLVAVFTEDPKLSSSSSSSSLFRSCYVEIEFSTKDLDESEIIKIIERYTDNEYWIEKIDTSKESEGTKVIIRFKEPEKASEFVRTVNEEIESAGDTLITNARLTSSPDANSCLSRCPKFFFFLFALIA